MPVGNHLFSDRVCCRAADRLVGLAFPHENPCRNDRLHLAHNTTFSTARSAAAAASEWLFSRQNQMTEDDDE
jgi:hypothetical protein